MDMIIGQASKQANKQTIQPWINSLQCHCKKDPSSDVADATHVVQQTRIYILFG
jgi:hypothetical protein